MFDRLIVAYIVVMSIIGVFVIGPSALQQWKSYGDCLKHFPAGTRVYHKADDTQGFVRECFVFGPDVVIRTSNGPRKWHIQDIGKVE